MKRVVIVLTLLMIPLLFMCSRNESETGDCLVVFSSTDQGRTILPEISMDIVTYRITGSGPQSAVLREQTISVQSQIQLTGLAAGSWTITVYGLNQDGDIVGSGSNAVVINAGSESSLTIKIVPLAGSGSLSVTVTWTASLVTNPVVNATLVSLSGQTAGISTAITGTGVALCSSTSLADGYYILNIQILDNTTVKGGLAEIVRIAAGQTTSETIAVAIAAVTVSTQIIADHTVVDRYDKIPAYYMAEVKKMMVCFPGESHSAAYRTGLELLETANSAYSCNVGEGETPTDQYLRVNQGFAGESTWYTWYAYDSHSGTNKDYIKNYIKEYVDHGHPLSTIGFGWCWDATWNSPGGTVDPVYKVRWAGASDGGPDGNMIWGLDADDYTLTGNRVCMDTYLQATEEYRTYCENAGYVTKIIFTTGPVDGDSGENGYQRHLKHEYTRNYVKSNSERILFDYADILSYDDDGSQNIISWTDGDGTVHNYPVITTANLGDGTIGHIGSAGAIRLAKAQWWLLARIAGWDGVATD